MSNILQRSRIQSIVVILFASYSGAEHLSARHLRHRELNPYVTDCGARKCHSTRELCVNTTVGLQECICNDGYTGPNCQFDEDECITREPCPMVGGFCVDHDPWDGRYKCDCLPGFTQGPAPNAHGATSCLEICSDEVCHPQAACTNTTEGLKCTCNEGFVGDGQNCTEFISCPDGFTGANCTEDENECISREPCPMAGGYCVNKNASEGGYSCGCLPDYIDGPSFDAHGPMSCLEVCSNGDICSANAACTNNTGAAGCTCNVGFDGDGQNCTACPDGYTGPHCQFDEDECISREPCPELGGFCVDHDPWDGRYKCGCTAGFTDGLHHDEHGPTTCVEHDECLLKVDNCSQNATCTNIVGGFNCTCNDGFVGDGQTCHEVRSDNFTVIDVLVDSESYKNSTDPCVPNPCREHQVCMNGTCPCVEGYIHPAGLGGAFA